MRQLSALFLVGLLTACGKKSTGTYDVPDAVAESEGPSAMDAESLWEQRHDVAKLEMALEKYEEAYNSNPRDRKIAAKLVRGYYFLGDAYKTETADKVAAWETAIEWGKKCLAINRDFTALLEKGNETEATAVRALGENDVPCMYWTASALGKWGKTQGLATLLKHKGTVYAYVTRVTELKPTFFYSAPDRYWGAYYSALPGFAGQDLDKSLAHFDASIAASPEYLGTKVLKASYWAYKAQDKDTFASLLGEVLAFDIESEPKIRAENMAEQAKARELLAQMDDLFAD